MAPQVVTVKCNYCSKFRPLSRVAQLPGHAQVMCDYCVDWHFKAIEVLAGCSGSGCQECGATWEYIMAAYPKGQRLWVIPKDGIYQLLCKRCVQPYLPKRQDLYKGTQFGNDALKLN
jgi:hypothetical protein